MGRQKRAISVDYHREANHRSEIPVDLMSNKKKMGMPMYTKVNVRNKHTCRHRGIASICRWASCGRELNRIGTEERMCLKCH